MMEQVKAVLFDFDDTLQDRAGAFRLYTGNFLSRYFPGLTQAEREQKMDEMEACVDGGYKPREVFWPEMIAFWGWKDAPSLEVLTDDFNGNFGKYVKLLPGAVDVLKALREKGYQIGMVTNGNSWLQNMKLDTAGIRPLFDVITVSGDLGIWKPERGIFDHAAKELGVPNENCLYIGDHPVNDIQGALGADMQVIWMNYGSFAGQNPHNAPEITDLSQLLERL